MGYLSPPQLLQGYFFEVRLDRIEEAVAPEEGAEGAPDPAAGAKARKTAFADGLTIGVTTHEPAYYIRRAQHAGLSDGFPRTVDEMDCCYGSGGEKYRILRFPEEIPYRCFEGCQKYF